VILLSILLAVSAGFVNKNLPMFRETGALIGISVSAFFLITIGIVNLVTLIETYKVWRKVIKGAKYPKENAHEHLHVGGFFIRFFHPILRSIQKSWQLYPVGFLFGLGFDTASEVGLLSLSAVSGTTNTPFWQIMLLPLAFTAGMALIDTLDGILMLGAYGWAYIKPVRKLYYNMNITLLSVVIAFLIGGIEILQIVGDKLMLNNPFFTFVGNLDLGSLGYIIIGLFVASWIFSVAFYRFKGYDKLD
jgi:high-affinity nickel-transport protein